MARKLDKDSVTFRPVGGGAKYPWGEWLDGDVWELVHGDDFEPHPVHFAQICQSAAKRKGIKCRTKREGNKLTIQAYIPDGTA